MSYLGEIISLFVAVSWTITALFAEVGSKRLGALQLNVIRMVLSLLLLGGTLWFFTDSFFPLYADGQTWFWLSLSGFVGYLLGDYCLFNSYILIGSRFGQLFMTLAPPAAAFSAWIMLGEVMTLQALLGMVVTLVGIGISVLNKGAENNLSFKLPLKGILFGVGAGVGQGIGLVLSKIGMECYEANIPATEETVTTLLPFASTFMRALTGAIGFIMVMAFQRKFCTLFHAMKDGKGMRAAIGATIAGPFIGVSLSLMAVQYTEAGIASTLMALTPVLILWPSHFFFRQQVSFKEIVGACVSVFGASLFFL